MFSWKTFQFNPQFKKDETIAIPPEVPHRQCAFCSDNIWTPAQFRQLSALADNQRHEQIYSRKASKFYDSLLAGCPWCAAIGNAILLSEDVPRLGYFSSLLSDDGDSEEVEDEEDAGNASEGMSSKFFMVVVNIQPPVSNAMGSEKASRMVKNPAKRIGLIAYPLRMYR